MTTKSKAERKQAAWEKYKEEERLASMEWGIRASLVCIHCRPGMVCPACRLAAVKAMREYIAAVEAEAEATKHPDERIKELEAEVAVLREALGLAEEFRQAGEDYGYHAESMPEHEAAYDRAGVIRARIYAALFPVGE